MRKFRVSLFFVCFFLIVTSGNIIAQRDSLPFFRLSGIDRWEGISKSRGNGGYISYYFSQWSVSDSSVVDGITFYRTGSSWTGFDPVTDRQYIILDSVRLLDLDFSVAPGQTYPNGMGVNALVTVSGNIDTRAFQCRYGFWPTNDRTETYLRDYGLLSSYVFMQMSSNWTEITSNTISQMRTKLNGEILYVPHDYIPGLNFTPVPSPATSNKVYFDSRASHSLISFMAPYSPSFEYLDTLILEYYYVNDRDSTEIYRHKVKARDINQFNYLFDTTYVKNGYRVKYRLMVRDKSIVPKFAYSPADQGYYTLAFNFTTDIDDETMPETYLQVSTYPNPFNNATTLLLDHPDAGEVVVELFSSTGEAVTETMMVAKNAGTLSIPLQLKSQPSGIYIANVAFLSVSGKVERKQQKLVYLK